MNSPNRLNIEICVFIGLLTIALNIWIYLQENNEKIKENLYNLASLSVTSSFLILLEVFDFPPILGLLGIGFLIYNSNLRHVTIHF